MGIYRTYFDKNTTIISNSTLNTARNPITQLFYGPNSFGINQYSRYLFHFDMSDVINKINDKSIINNVTHTLKMKNTSFFDTELVGSNIKGYKRAYSFDLILFKINEDWDAGVGYDYSSQVFQSDNNNTYIKGPANWYNRTTTDNWTSEGIVDYNTTTPYIVTTQHFDDGNEDIEMDLTDEVNSIITGGTNYGYCISYRHDYEVFSGLTQQQYSGFYAKDTNTYYEPFIETTWDDLIQDDRGYFFMNSNNKIFYYAIVNGELVNLDSLPAVQINDENNTLYSSGTASQLSKGVYYYQLMVPEDTTLDRFQYKDIWTVIYNGQSKTVSGKITLLNNNNFLPEIGTCNTF
jgi:hypothetical protein